MPEPKAAAESQNIPFWALCKNTLIKLVPVLDELNRVKSIKDACTSRLRNKLAICWDGTSKAHPSQPGVWCTVKNMNFSQCEGGGAPGYAFVCTQM